MSRRLFAAALLFFSAPALAFEIRADPDTYLGAVVVLGPGDTLHLAPGLYRDCLILDGLHGTKEQPIVVTGPPDRSAVFLGERCDGWTNRYRVVVKIQDSSYLVLRNLEIDGEGRAVDGVEAGYGDTPVHHITLENLYIHDNAVSNQQNGISSFATAWDWVIRGNIIERVGTGMYLGNSDGRDPFIRGTIEDNLILNPLGYGIQIKHQRRRPRHDGMPPDGSVTELSRNVIVKETGSALGASARPSLLLGHLPLEGPGMNDRYRAYGNLFFENQSDVEPLVQLEGNVELVSNVLVNSYAGGGVWVRPHNDLPKDVSIVGNTILTAGPAVRIEGVSPMHRQVVYGNAVFSDSPLPAFGPNFVRPGAEAAFLLADPPRDLHPLPGALTAPADVTVPGPDFDLRSRHVAHYGAFGTPGPTPIEIAE